MDSQGDKKPLKIGKIVVDRNLCIGAASCVAVAPGVFELDAENKAVVYNPEGADAETILLAAKSCPTMAISIFDDEGNQIYPQYMKEICRLDDTELASRGWRAFQLTNGRPAIIIKSGDELRAFVNRCPHAAGEVYPATNEAGAERLKCNQHGSLFTVEGMGLTGPATGMSLRALQLTLQDGVIYYQ